jgi:hypothetical protein
MPFARTALLYHLRFDRLRKRQKHYDSAAFGSWLPGLWAVYCLVWAYCYEAVPQVPKRMLAVPFNVCGVNSPSCERSVGGRCFPDDSGTWCLRLFVRKPGVGRLSCGGFPLSAKRKEWLRELGCCGFFLLF